MADSEQEFTQGFANAQKTSTANRNNTTGNVATPVNYADVGAMRTRLTAINAGYYTAARLNGMTKNDMVYALRVNDDATGINARGATA